MIYSDEQLISYVKEALNKLYIEDKVLIKNNLHEQCVVACFYRHLIYVLINNNFDFTNLSVDLEYNKDVLS